MSALRAAVLALRCFALAALLVAGAASAQQDRLHVYNWNNYITDDTAERFEKTCRCRLVQDYYADNEEMLAKLAAGPAACILVPTGDAGDADPAGGAAPIERERLPKPKPAPNSSASGSTRATAIPCPTPLDHAGLQRTENARVGGLTDSWAAILSRAPVCLRVKVTVLDTSAAVRGVYLGHPA
jgi:hypothetical protein